VKEQDWVEDIFVAWAREFPEEDTAALKTVTRLARLDVLLAAFQQQCLSPLGLVMSDFMVLASLRRLGAPYQATPSTLYNVMERSSGGMTKMIKRLDAMGLIERLPDPADGRGSLVRLTERGIDIHGQAFHRFVEGSNALLADASVARGKELDRSLAFLVRAFEDYQGG
jgi:DNA-binding MarR family transcriptional regulator